MSRKKINIGLFGFGCVGFGLYKVLERTPGLKANIRKICVKHEGKLRPLPSALFTYDRHEILSDPEIDVVVELIDDPDAAFEIVSAALKSGKAVVSANKKMIAEHFQELLDLQDRYQVPLLYEAACCASIPIIRNLEEYFDTDLLESIEGIVNGSTNYILSKIFSDNRSYAAALHEAQQQGYAETNPLLDTGGFDAKYKLLILIAHAFGVVVRPDHIYNLGIDRLADLDLRYAREKKYKIKLVAQAYKTADENVVCYVMPKFISQTDKLYNVDDVYNGVITKTCFTDLQFFVGKGAGAHPTASAVLSDLSALTYDYRYAYKKINPDVKLVPADEILLKVFLRFDSRSPHAFRASFQTIEEVYENQDHTYIIGILTLDKIIGMLDGKNPDASCILIEPVQHQYEGLDSPGLQHIDALVA